MHIDANRNLRQPSLRVREKSDLNMAATPHNAFDLVRAICRSAVCHYRFLMKC